MVAAKITISIALSRESTILFPFHRCLPRRRGGRRRHHLSAASTGKHHIIDLSTFRLPPNTGELPL